MTVTHTISRRESILQAALAAFSSVGYESTSIEDICATAPASVGSFYHHFGSKDGVAAALVTAAVDQFQEGMQAALAEPLSPRAMVSILVSSHLTWVRDNELWARYLLQMGAAPATAAAQPAVRQKNRSLVAAIEAWSAPVIEQGVIVPLHPTALLAQILGPSYFVSRAWLAGGPEITDQLIGQFSDAAWRSVQLEEVPGATRLR
ncbi:MAG: TetR/AcrR family transcriptional regulator [Acidimicrobiia bacterium]|nr:TetR/AcrR family transcriptional regulator [Acidimicrobiia bacterium]MDX2468882.1 TetR/AcrR family transcriptional regulator [Acidimicrobiia bacterium]